jgi:hypothetical protein
MRRAAAALVLFGLGANVAIAGCRDRRVVVGVLFFRELAPRALLLCELGVRSPWHYSRRRRPDTDGLSAAITRHSCSTPTVMPMRRLQVSGRFGSF